MKITDRPGAAIAAGALVVLVMAFVGGQTTGPSIAAALAEQSEAAIAAEGGAGRVEVSFAKANGWASRHPTLSGAEGLDDATRRQIALAIGAIPGVGGVRWADGRAPMQAGSMPLRPLHCQEDVANLLRARSIRFEEGSARIDRASNTLVDEVASALRPCLGATIAITGHTDSSGPLAANMILSAQRALAVREALVARGIPGERLRARGLGPSRPIEGLDPADPANRRIEFAVIAVDPVTPTPVDTPAPR